MARDSRRAWLLAWLALVPLALLPAGQLANSDAWWQIRTGQLIASTGRLPRTDPFSWTAAGRPWRLNSWAYDVLLSAAHHAAGLAGAAFLGGALAAGTVAAMLALARWWQAPPLAAVLTLMIGLVPLLDWLSTRPHLVDYAAVPLLVLLAERVLTAERIQARTASVAGILLLQAIWANLHAAATLGLAVVGLLCAADLASRFRGGGVSARLPWYAAIFGAALGGAMANPYGVGILTQASAVREASRQILEWAPVSTDRPADLLALALVTAGIAAAIAQRRWGPAVLVVALGVSGVFMIRFIPIAASVALPLMASAVGNAAAPARYLDRRRTWLTAAVAACVAIFMIATAAAIIRPTRTDQPVGLIAQLPAGCRLMNNYDLGGAVILLRPDVRVSLDSRSDLYGPALIASVSRTEPASFPQLGVTCALLHTNDFRVAALRSDPQWREVGVERKTVLFVQSAEPAS